MFIQIAEHHATVLLPVKNRYYFSWRTGKNAFKRLDERLSVFADGFMHCHILLAFPHVCDIPLAWSDEGFD